MARKLKENQNIKGIKMRDTVQLLSQFADDTTLYLTHEPVTFQNVIQTLLLIETQTGLKVSYDKTVIYRTGSLANTDARIYTVREIQWTNDPIKILGVSFNNDLNTDFDYSNIIDKMERVLCTWYNRQLTLMGKTLVVNTLCESLFVYHMTVLPNMRNKFVERVNNCINKFVWGEGKRARIAKDALTSAKHNGGLRLFDVKIKQDCLKLSWIPTIIKETFFEKCFSSAINIPLSGREILQCNVSASDASLYCDVQEFWGQLWIAWCNYSFTKPENIDEIMNENLWFNSHIKSGNKPMWNRKAYEKGIRKIEHIHDPTQNTGISRYDEVSIHYITWFSYQTLVNAIPKYWKIAITSSDGSYNEIPEKTYALLATNKVSNVIFKKLTTCTDHLKRYLARWQGTLGDDVLEYRKCFAKLYQVTSITKLRDFQYRLLLKKLPTNECLYKWGKSDTPLCTFCNLEVETIIHLLFQCKFSKRIWTYLNTRTQNSNLWFDKSNNIIPKTLIMNNSNDKMNHVSNFIVLITKQYIYRYKCFNKIPNINGLKNEIRNHYYIEEYIAKKELKIEKHKKKWENVNTQLITPNV